MEESRTLNVGDVLIFGRHVVTIDRVTDTRAYAGTYPVFYRKGIDSQYGIGFRQYGSGYWSMHSLAHRPKPGELEKRAAEQAHFENVGNLANEIGMTRWHQLTREKLEAIKKIINQ